MFAASSGSGSSTANHASRISPAVSGVVLLRLITSTFADGNTLVGVDRLPAGVTVVPDSLPESAEYDPIRDVVR